MPLVDCWILTNDPRLSRRCQRKASLRRAKHWTRYSQGWQEYCEWVYHLIQWCCLLTQTLVLWIQISGASLLSIPDVKANRFGEASQKLFDDLKDASEVRDLIDTNSTRIVDQHVLGFAESHPKRVRTALIFPPIIFGIGRGLGNNKSIQIPSLCRTALARHRSAYVGRGQACWGNVHIADLANLAADLVNASASSRTEPELWNANGLYFPATSEMVSATTNNQFSTSTNFTTDMAGHC